MSQLNRICGGVKNTTWTSQTTGTDYKDYKYGKNELNETDQYVDYGGTDTECAYLNNWHSSSRAASLAGW